MTIKGQDTFTSLEVQTIKKLIAEKVVATLDEQKRIREKIRSIGFYYSDFSSQKNGYTVEYFEQLINLGQIKISN